MDRGNGGVGVGLWFLLMVVMVEYSLACGRCSPILFNFGDSNSDTGGYSAGFGVNIPLPDGRVFFHRSTGRPCDGRLIIDFLCESLNTSYLSPYLESLHSDFRNGANFAISGSTTLPRDRPFALYMQLQQFLHFKSRSLDLIKQGSKGLLNEEDFKNSLYTIDMGQNDLAGLFSSNLTYDQIVIIMPQFIAEIRNAVQTLYDNGGRNFWIHNTGPLGCLPQKLALPRLNDSDLDANGCLRTYNNAAKRFNAKLSSLCNELSSELKNATIVYTDIFAIKYGIIANYNKYGFVKPLMACCGYGGAPYNFNPNITCLAPGYQVCSDGSKYVSWDGVHYTEAANSLVASKILTAEYSKPKIKFDFFCKA
ncbi:GDSL esterase/lipase At1g09390-like [Typha angustifolia]|uniref:GDSL esterase/lipase At1g09390-like n=1 Tax=Typha angustifolia TaxID=59011 RepID=UPI003C2E474C